MFELFWTSPDGFFGTEILSTQEEVKEQVYDLEREGCKTVVTNLEIK